MTASIDGSTGESCGVGGCVKSGGVVEADEGVCSADGDVRGCMDGCVFCMIGGEDEVSGGTTKGGEFRGGRSINSGRKCGREGTGCCRGMMKV